MPKDNEIQKAIKEQHKIAQLIIDNTKERSAKRPTAPKELTKEEKVIWKDTVTAKPADFFSADKLPSLIQYCKHIASMNRFYKMRDELFSYYPDDEIAVDKDKLKQLDALQLMISREAKAAAILSKDMGLMAKPEVAPAKSDDEEESPFPQGI